MLETDSGVLSETGEETGDASKPRLVGRVSGVSQVSLNKQEVKREQMLHRVVFKASGAQRDKPTDSSASVSFVPVKFCLSVELRQVFKSLPVCEPQV